MNCDAHNKLMPHFECEESERYLDEFEARLTVDRFQHRWEECGHRADFSSAATHDRDCPAVPDTARSLTSGGEGRG